MKSPGAPSLRREVEREFWRQIAVGITTEEAAITVGVSPAVGARWFRHRGGMPIDLSATKGRYLSFHEREEIAILKAEGRRRQGDCPAAGAGSFDDLAGTAPQRRHPRGQARVSSVGGSVEGGTRGSAPEDGEARRQRASV